TGPGGSSQTVQTTTVDVNQLPDAASRPPQAPATYSGAQPLGNVTLNVGTVSTLSAFAGVGFALNPVSLVSASYNNSIDNTTSDFHAQINWGDSPQWDSDTGLVSESNGILVKGTHIYQKTGNFDVTVYVTGPDGQTASATTTKVLVTQLPDAASRP